MAWTAPAHSRGRVDAAGKMLIGLTTQSSPSFDRLGLSKAIEVIDNWRSSHSYPLQVVKMTLLNRARRIDPDAIVAQRLKRLESIYGKLINNPRMKLSQMQDIGGCRAIVSSRARLDQLVTTYDKLMAEARANRPELFEKYNYIATPKPDGYRSVHFVCRYRTTAAPHLAHNNLRIEIQLRTRRQHAWATAVETVSTFTGEALRSTTGSELWRRFFALMGSAIAIREKCPPVPGTPSGKDELTREIRNLSRHLKVRATLRGYGAAVQRLTTSPAGARLFLLVLDSNARTTQVRPFQMSELDRATAEYLAAEKQISDRRTMQAVLVSVDSVAALRRAYPNFYLDAKEFLAEVRRASGFLW